MVGRLHVQEVGVEGGRQRQPLVTTGQRVLLVHREQRVRERLADVLVAGDEPGGVAVGTGDAVHGSGVAQAVVDGVRVVDEAFCGVHALQPRQRGSGVVLLNPPPVAPVDERGQPLPQLRDGGGQIECQQLAVAHQDTSVDDRRRHVRGAGAVDEGGGEIVHGLGVRAAEVDEDDVGAPPRREAADPLAQADGPRALECRVVQGLTGGQPSWVSSVDFCTSEVSAIDSHTSRELFDAAPSVASPTGTPISRRARTGVGSQANLR